MSGKGKGKGKRKGKGKGKRKGKGKGKGKRKGKRKGKGKRKRKIQVQGTQQANNTLLVGKRLHVLLIRLKTEVCQSPFPITIEVPKVLIEILIQV